MTYKIGDFDERFHISKSEFLHSLEEASNLWNTGAHTTILHYQENGVVTVNLVYDDRQKITETNNELSLDAAKINDLAHNVKSDYDTLKKQREDALTSYNTTINLFEQKEKDYNTKVSYWNKEGGAPQDIYQSLILQKENLTQIAQELEQKRIIVNKLTDDVNAFARHYNLLVTTANNTIDKINTFAGQEFEEGVYDPQKHAITIYEFSSDKKLIRVLAHELGHALLLPHNENKTSIMYPLNEATTLLLSKEDLAALKLRCTTGYPFINFYYNLKEKFAVLQG